MIQLTEDFKEQVLSALFEQREKFGGSEKNFAAQHGINHAVYNRLKNGERERLLSDAKWLNLGRAFGITLNERKWNTARTEVFSMIEEDVLFCKEYSKGRIFVDDCGIGKSYTAKYLSRTLSNCFYLDASQCKTKHAFIRAMAKTIGIGEAGKIQELKDNTKYYLSMLPQPVIIIDEAGDMEYSAFLELKEYWNATEGFCGWYLMGADGLREKIERGRRNKTVGFAEMFSRLSEKYSRSVPLERNEKLNFYKKLITDVLSVNIQDEDVLKKVVARCLTVDETGHIGGLRRAESLAILYAK
jgi:hypothetical protein